MSDFDALREKVEQTAGRLAAAQTNRQRRTEDLLEMLGKLEDKFNVQQEQLTHYRSRVEPLEQSNREMCELMHSLLNIIDADIVAGQDDPLHRAVDMATRMLAEDMAPAVAVEGQHGGAAEPDMRFEDASAELLEVEAESETDAELPAAASDAEAEALAMSIGAGSAELSADIELLDDEPTAGAAAMSGPSADDGPDAEADDSESLAAELNIPEPVDETVIEAAAESAVAEALEDALDSMSEAENAVAEGAGPDKPDIRSLLKRVEEAARQARALTRGHAGAGDGEDAAPAAEADETTEPPDPDHGNAAA